MNKNKITSLKRFAIVFFGFLILVNFMQIFNLESKPVGFGFFEESEMQVLDKKIQRLKYEITLIDASILKSTE